MQRHICLQRMCSAKDGNKNINMASHFTPPRCQLQYGAARSCTDEDLHYMGVLISDAGSLRSVRRDSQPGMLRVEALQSCPQFVVNTFVGLHNAWTRLSVYKAKQVKVRKVRPMYIHFHGFEFIDIKMIAVCISSQQKN